MVYSLKNPSPLCLIIQQNLFGEGFDKNISKLIICANEFNWNIPFLCFLNKVKSKVNVLGPGVLNLIFY